MAMNLRNTKKIDYSKPLLMECFDYVDPVKVEYAAPITRFVDGWSHAIYIDGEMYLANDFGDIYGVSGSVIRNKPLEPKYRPYEPYELAALVGTAVQYKTESCTALIVSHEQSKPSVYIAFKNNTVLVHCSGLLVAYTHMDGSPCGVLEE